MSFDTFLKVVEIAVVVLLCLGLVVGTFIVVSEGLDDPYEEGRHRRLTPEPPSVRKLSVFDQDVVS